MTEDQDVFYGQIITAGHDAAAPGDALRTRVLEASTDAAASGTPYERTIAPRWGRLRPAGAIAAAVAAVALGMFALWPGGGRGENGQAAWWLGPPSAWAQEIGAAMGQVRGAVCRMRTMVADPNGHLRPVGNTSSIFYVGEDSCRHDIYERDTLREIQWYTPDGDGMMQTSVSFDLRCWSACRHPGSDYRNHGDPVVEGRAMVASALDQIGRLLGESTIDNHQCVGIETVPRKEKAYPNPRFKRVWFDVKTKLPVRIESHGSYLIGHPEIPVVYVCHYDWDPVLPADMFEPNVPPSFVNAHRDEVTAKKAAAEVEE